jgi:hypothetical protein
MSTEGPFAQQFSLNSFYGNRGGHREGLRLQKAMLGGFGALGLREPSGLRRMIWVHVGNATAWLATGSFGDLDGVDGR